MGLTRGESVSAITITAIADVTQRSRRSELVDLVENLGWKVAKSMTLVIPRRINVKTYFSKGVLDQILSCAGEEKVQRIVFDADLSERHIRNFARQSELEIFDRTDIILQIFARRALRHEGQLQVALALAQHRAARLVKVWSHLERQRGGYGFVSGPGESQLEIDRRLLLKEIKRLKVRVEQLRRRRIMQRRSRLQSGQPRVAILGYTNAGKTSIFNILTKDRQIIRNRLFETLDPVSREFCFFDAVQKVHQRGVIIDSVGFIRELPPMLKEAFHATFSEIATCSILVHVLDGSDPEAMNKYRIVQQEVEEFLPQDGQVHHIVFINKCDQPIANGINIEGAINGSALKGEGIDALKESILAYIRRGRKTYCLPRSEASSAALAWLARGGNLKQVYDQQDEDNWRISLSEIDLGRLIKKFPDLQDSLFPDESPSISIFQEGRDESDATFEQVQ